MLRESLQALNWTAIGLAAAIVFLGLGFLMLYRSGFDVSLGQLVTQTGAGLLLLPQSQGGAGIPFCGKPCKLRAL